MDPQTIHNIFTLHKSSLTPFFKPPQQKNERGSLNEVRRAM